VDWGVWGDPGATYPHNANQCPKFRDQVSELGQHRRAVTVRIYAPRVLIRRSECPNSKVPGTFVGSGGCPIVSYPIGKQGTFYMFKTCHTGRCRSYRSRVGFLRIR
jgi:hypothetical protein